VERGGVGAPVRDESAHLRRNCRAKKKLEGTLETIPLSEQTTHDSMSLLGMITNSGPIVLAVLIILIVLSVWTWTIMIAKALQFKQARERSKEFSTLFWETRNLSRLDDSARRLEGSPLVNVFHAGYRELNHLFQESEDSRRRVASGELGSVERALKRAEFEEAQRLEKGITFLASVASAAPFIGLFGTVIGIMNSFHGLSSAKGTTIQAVAPGISEALLATAVGLAAAIPSAVAYNYFAVIVRQMRQAMSSFCEEFLSVARQSASR
jgi:biopolymer transport protein TolQ